MEPMNELLLLLCYTFAIHLVLQKASFFEEANLSRPLLSFFFVLKIGVGLFYGWLYQYYFKEGDTYLFLSEAKALYAYWTVAGAEVYEYPPWAIFWKDFGTYAFIHVQALVQPFTWGYYSLHIVLTAWLGTLGGLVIFRALSPLMLGVKSGLLAGLIFGLPSVLFWTSGLHKDSLIYLSLAFILYGLSHRLRLGHFHTCLYGGLALMLLFRPYLLALLLPCLLGFVLCLRFPQRHPLVSYLWIYGLMVLGLGLVEWFYPNYGPLSFLAGRQRLFNLEAGGSNLEHFGDLGEGGWWYVLKSLPWALVKVLARPFLWECQDFLQLMAAIEVLICLTVLGIWAFARRGVAQDLGPLGYFMLFYALSNLVLVGLLVSNLGTIVRYRSLALGLLVWVAASTFQWLRQPWAMEVKKRGRPLQKLPLPMEGTSQP